MELNGFILSKDYNKVTDKSYVDIMYMSGGDTIEVIGNICENEVD